MYWQSELPKIYLTSDYWGAERLTCIFGLRVAQRSCMVTFFQNLLSFILENCPTGQLNLLWSDRHIDILIGWWLSSKSCLIRGELVRLRIYLKYSHRVELPLIVCILKSRRQPLALRIVVNIFRLFYRGKALLFFYHLAFRNLLYLRRP